MRLINVHTLQLEDFVSSRDIPPYAILSHTWDGNEEVSYHDWLAAGPDPGSNVARDSTGRRKGGYAKILGAAEQARARRCDYLWVDTNCIDKTSSAELSEAINSMFDWYKRSKVCLVHLADVAAVQQPGPDDDDGSGNDKDNNPGPIDAGPDLEHSRWFRRGWTLQELLAPRRLIFFSADWKQVGTGSTLMSRLSTITGIAADYIRKDTPLWTASVAEKFSWLAGRTTTREEDTAYCMLGIFRINMPLLYGEGPRAFVRLQEEIIRRTNDHTIFCWSGSSSSSNDTNRANSEDSLRPEVPSILATSPQQFAGNRTYSVDFSTSMGHNPAFAWTNAGLNIQAAVIHCYRSHYMVLDANAASNRRHHDQRLCLPVDGNIDKGIVGRAADPIIMPALWASGALSYRNLFFPPSPEKWIASRRRRPGMAPASSHAFLITFDRQCRGTYPSLVSVDTSTITKPAELNLALTSHFDPYSSILELTPSRNEHHHVIDEDYSSYDDDENEGQGEEQTGQRVHPSERPSDRVRPVFHEAMLLLATRTSKFLIWVCMREASPSPSSSNPSLSPSSSSSPSSPLFSKEANIVTAHYVFPPVPIITPTTATTTPTDTTGTNTAIAHIATTPIVGNTSAMRDTWLREKRAFLAARRRQARRNHVDVGITRGPASTSTGPAAAVRGTTTTMMMIPPTLVPLRLSLKTQFYE